MKLILVVLLAGSSWASPHIKHSVNVDYRNTAFAVPNTANSSEANNVLARKNPFIVSVQTVSEIGEHVQICTGALISHRHVLCAASCLRNANIMTLEAVCGAHDLKNITEPTQQRRKVGRVIVHPKFNEDKMKNDIAIIEMREQIDATDDCKLIKIPSQSFLWGQPDGDCTLVGWATSNSTGTDSTILTEHTLKIVSHLSCSLTYIKSKHVTTDMLCAKHIICDGQCKKGSDPLICQNSEKEATVAGLLSWGAIPCERNDYPEVFTKVSAYSNWIHRTVGAI